MPSKISIDFKNDGAALIYPNPAHDFITIHLPSSPGASVLSFYDAQGKLVMKQRVESNTTVQQINITKLAAGIYYISLQQQKAAHVLKLLKQ